MDSPATSLSISFVDTNGLEIDQPREWTEALIEVSVDPEQWDSARLSVNDADYALSLRRIGGSARVMAEWPRANAGSYLLHAEVPGSSVTRRITIMPSKLSAGSFEKLVSDLESRLPAAVAIGLQRAGGLAGLTLLRPEETTIAQELARLRRAVIGTASRPGLVAVLPELGHDPHRILETDELWLRTGLARRPHPARLMEAIRVPGNMPTGEGPLRVIDQRVHQSVDVYENRLVRLYYDQVFQRVRRLHRRLLRMGSEAQVDEVSTLLRGLVVARRQATFIDEVSSTTHPPTSVTMVLLKRPAYRAAFEGFLELHRSIAVRLDDPRLDLPLENLPALYQLWGALSVYAVLLDVASSLGYRVDHQRLVQRERDGLFVRVIPQGQVALRLVHPETDTVLTLLPEKSYGHSGEIRSISFTQIPDITIRVERPGSKPVLLLLDPKYKLDSENEGTPGAVSQPKKVDVDKMHAYRDAIRTLDGTRIVTSACTIYPGPSVQYWPGIEAIQGDPLLASVLEQRVGEILRNALC